MTPHLSHRFPGKPRVLLGALAAAMLVACGAGALGRAGADGATYIDGIDVAQGFPPAVAAARTASVDQSRGDEARDVARSEDASTIRR